MTDSDGTAVQFVTVFHGDGSDSDSDRDGTATANELQDTPEQWYARHPQRRGVSASASNVSNANTIRDSQATQALTATMAAATEPMQSMAATENGAVVPTFVNSKAILPESTWTCSSNQEMEDEEETQILMSFSQDPVATMRLKQNQLLAIEEEEVHAGAGAGATAPIDPMLKDSVSMETVVAENDANASESEMSDDMLEQDGDLASFSSIAAALQQNEDSEQARTAANDSAMLRVSLILQSNPLLPETDRTEDEEDEDETGEETEVEEEPMDGWNKPMPHSLTALGKRSISISTTEAGREKKPRRLGWGRSRSTGDTSEATTSSPLWKRRTSGDPSQNLEDKSNAEALNATSEDDKQEQEPSENADNSNSKEAEQPPPQVRTQRRATTLSTPTKPPKATRPRATTPNKEKKTAATSASTSSAESKVSSSSLGVMFTGLDGTLPELRNQVTKIAGAYQEDDDVERVTLLIAPNDQMKRTVKLLCGISCCDHVVDERWLDASAKAGRPVDPKLHCLHDPNAESKWHFSLAKTMYDVPKTQRRQLFSGLEFFLPTHKSILPPARDLVKIVECAGGRATTKGTPSADAILITSQAALATASVKKALNRIDRHNVYSPELILSSILQQQIDYDAHRLSIASPATAAASATPTRRRKKT